VAKNPHRVREYPPADPETGVKRSGLKLAREWWHTH
jgi:hypothetical protein